MTAAYQPRWLAYARATSTPPDQVKGYEYIVWIGQRWREWEAETGHAGSKGPDDHEAFDRWLADTAAPAAQQEGE